MTEKQLINRELREAEIKMTGRPPASAIGFIGFVPAVPGSTPAAANGQGQTHPVADTTQPQRPAAG